MRRLALDAANTVLCYMETVMADFLMSIS